MTQHIDQIILASGSPRRQQLLRDLGLVFQIITADIDETPHPDEDPIVLVRRLAESKAQAVAQKCSTSLIIAADTMVALENELLGKPTDEAHARQLLTQLRDRTHQVHSALSMVLLDSNGTVTKQATRINTSTIYMRNYSNAEIEEYIASGDPLDKAGAYAIQHPTFAPAAKLDGCISGVMGVALVDLIAMLADFGVEVQQEIRPICEAHASFPCCQNMPN